MFFKKPQMYVYVQSLLYCYFLYQNMLLLIKKKLPKLTKHSHNPQFWHSKILDAQNLGLLNFFFKTTLKEIINENRNLFNRDVTKNWRRLLFLRSKKNCPSMLKTNQVTTVYVWKKHASMTRFIWAKCLFIFFCLLRISLNGKCQTKNYSCKNALRFRWQFQCDLILVC
jgi:hypothetical protein